jgi:tetratricopeptide (TPR) repeat protein
MYKQGANPKKYIICNMNWYIRAFLLVLLTAGYFMTNFCYATVTDTVLKVNDGNGTNYLDSMGTYYSKQSDNRRAIHFYKKAIGIKRDENDTSGLISTYEKISYSYLQLKDYRMAIEYGILAARLRQDTADKYFSDVKKLLAAPADSLNLTRLYYRYALFLSHRGKKRESLDFFINALKLARALKYDKAVSTIANDLAGEYWDLGKIKLSNIRYAEALSAAKRINDSNRMAAVHLNLGDNFKEQGKFEQGMTHLITALKIKEAIYDSARLSFYYIKAAEIAKAAGNKNKWKQYIQKAYEIRNLDNCATLTDKAIIYENLGAIAEDENLLQKAFLYYDTLISISEKINYTNGMITALNNKAQLYKKLGNIRKAVNLIEKAGKYRTENPYYKISGNNIKAGLYLKMKNYKKALVLLQDNVSNPVLNNYAAEKLLTFKLLYEVYTKMSKYKEAFQWNDSLRSFENFLRDKEVRSKIAELETKYQTEKHKHTISLLLAKNEIYTQQIRFALAFITGLIFIIVLGIYIARMSRMKWKLRENKLQQQLLLSQMNPHFIFNALSSIQQMIKSGKTVDADFYLGKFASITRIVLEYSREESIPLEKEIEVLQSYIELEKLRLDNSFDYKIELKDNLETEFINIPPMAIQPFVENAIKHGLKDKEDKGSLLLVFEDLGDVLKIVIEDNGVGIYSQAKEMRRQHKSMAMEIFEMRRMLMQKRFKKKLYVRFLDLSRQGATGTRVIIHLPIL